MKKEDVMKKVEGFIQDNWKRMAKIEVNVHITDSTPETSSRQYFDIDVVMD